MFRTLIAVLMSGLWMNTALAVPVIVWMDDELPSDRDKRRAEADTRIEEGPATHLYAVDLMYPPAPSSSLDDDRYAALRSAVIAGKLKWDEFDVELSIAREIQRALDGIDVVRNERDREELVEALLLQGAAVSRAFPPNAFKGSGEGTEGEEDLAEPFRATVPGQRVISPWLDALALAPGRKILRADVADGGPFPALEDMKGSLAELPPGYLDVAEVPSGVQVVVDGMEVSTEETELALPAGRHWVHVLRQGIISGRQRVTIEAGRTTALPVAVGDETLDAARGRLTEGGVVELPEEVGRALALVDARYSQPMFLASTSGNKLAVVPWGVKKPRRRRRPVTFVGSGELGAALVVSPAFEDSQGEAVQAPGPMGHIGLEFGIFNFALIGGMDVVVTPNQTIAFGSGGGNANRSTSVLPQPYAGVGAYVLRPLERRPTLLVAGTYSWLAPAHSAFGGRLSFGLPISKKGTWIRLTGGGSGAARSNWDKDDLDGDGVDTPMWTVFGRLGFAARF